MSPRIIGLRKDYCLLLFIPCLKRLSVLGSSTITYSNLKSKWMWCLIMYKVLYFNWSTRGTSLSTGGHCDQHSSEIQTDLDIHCPSRVVVSIKGKLLEFSIHWSYNGLTKNLLESLWLCCDIREIHLRIACSVILLVLGMDDPIKMNRTPSVA